MRASPEDEVFVQSPARMLRSPYVGLYPDFPVKSSCTPEHRSRTGTIEEISVCYGRMAGDSEHKFAVAVARIAADTKSEDVTVMDLRGLSSVADYFVICTGSSDRQMRAVCDEVCDYGRKLGVRPLGITGYEAANWILVDFVDVVLHIFTQHHRQYYDLELLWGDAPRVEWTRAATA